MLVVAAATRERPMMSSLDRPKMCSVSTYVMLKRSFRSPLVRACAFEPGATARAQFLRMNFFSVQLKYTQMLSIKAASPRDLCYNKSS